MPRTPEFDRKSLQHVKTATRKKHFSVYFVACAYLSRRHCTALLLFSFLIDYDGFFSRRAVAAAAALSKAVRVVMYRLVKPSVVANHHPGVLGNSNDIEKSSNQAVDFGKLHGAFFSLSG